MPLPKINTPTYELVLPSTGKKIKYRPFLVREEKILIMAMESEDMNQITSAIIQIITDCILAKDIKVESLATFDIEYLFLNIRAKSVGETIEVNITCPDDGETQVEMSINIDDIKVKKTRGHKNIVKLDDDISMKLKYPSLNQFIENNFEVSQTNTGDIGQSLSMISSCIEMVYNQEESWEASDCTQKELSEFIEQMNTKQFKQIEKFFTTMPKLSHEIAVKNPNTGVESEVLLEGLAAFFS
jgi:secreted Zn-dependent insulinase-like peptidase